MIANLTRFIRFLLVDNGPVTLVAALGLAAVYLLLPRPRNSVRAGAALAGLTLLLAGVLIVRANVATPEVILFYAFSGIAVVAGGLLVTQSNPARAALSFALVVLSTCGLFLLQAAPFLMATTIIIYAGAIIVTFLFVLMLAQQSGVSDADRRSREPLLAAVTGFILLGSLLYVLNLSYGTDDLDGLLATTRRAKDAASVKEMSDVLGDVDEGNQAFFTGFRKAVLKEQEKVDVGAEPEVRSVSQKLADEALNLQSVWLDARQKDDADKARAVFADLEKVALRARESFAVLQPRSDRPMSSLSGPPANLALYPSLGDDARPAAALRRDEATGRPKLPAENTAYLGRALFTDHLLAVELAGTLLLVATVGAIAIAHRRGERNA